MEHKYISVPAFTLTQIMNMTAKTLTQEPKPESQLPEALSAHYSTLESVSAFTIRSSPLSKES
jgi:hypothetical protein